MATPQGVAPPVKPPADPYLSDQPGCGPVAVRSILVQREVELESAEDRRLARSFGRV